MKDDKNTKEKKKKTEIDPDLIRNIFTFICPVVPAAEERLKKNFLPPKNKRNCLEACLS